MKLFLFQLRGYAFPSVISSFRKRRKHLSFEWKGEWYSVKTYFQDIIKKWTLSWTLTIMYTSINLKMVEYTISEF